MFYQIRFSNKWENPDLGTVATMWLLRASKNSHISYNVQCIYFATKPCVDHATRRARYFIIKPRASPQIYQKAVYLKFKWYAKETGTTSTWINVYTRRIQLNQTVFRCGRSHSSVGYPTLAPPWRNNDRYGEIIVILTLRIKCNFG